MLRTLTLTLTVPVVATVLAVALAPAADAAKGGKGHGKRRGGTVEAAWPNGKGKAPDRPLARWLANQVGPVPTEKGAKASRATARAAAAPTVTARAAATPTATAAASKLLLVRSFDIPTSDPDHARLANLSWTYDNALASVAFLSSGSDSIAQQLLDQLQALQNADGSLSFSYDVLSGAGSKEIYSGALAWVGVAATAYRREKRSTRYDALLSGITRYLLTLQRSDGLLRGGPADNWVSTQHNILAASYMRDLGANLTSRRQTLPGGLTGAQVSAAAARIGDAVLAKFLITQNGQTYFVQGIDDIRFPADVQSLGVMYLLQRGETAKARAVGQWLRANLYDTGTTTVAGKGPFTGFRPFAFSAAPNVIWTEGTFQAARALGLVDLADSAVVTAVLGLSRTTNGGQIGPIGADRDLSTDRWGEYHTWPTSAAGSWLIMLTERNSLIFAGDGDGNRND